MSFLQWKTSSDHRSIFKDAPSTAQAAPTSTAMLTFSCHPRMFGPDLPPPPPPIDAAPRATLARTATNRAIVTSDSPARAESAGGLLWEAERKRLDGQCDATKTPARCGRWCSIREGNKLAQFSQKPQVEFELSTHGTPHVPLPPLPGLEQNPVLELNVAYLNVLPL